MTAERDVPADDGSARRGPGIGERGLTLVEMVMVLAFIGVLAAMVVPRGNTATYQTRAVMDAVGTTLLSAQRLALTRQHDVVVSFDRDQDVFRMLYDADNDGERDDGEHVRVVPLGEGVTFGRGPAPALAAHPGGPVTFSQTRDGDPAVTFRRSGSASASGAVYLTSVVAERTDARPEDAKAIEIVRATGRPSWYHYVPGSGWERGF